MSSPATLAPASKAPIAIGDLVVNLGRHFGTVVAIHEVGYILECDLGPNKGMRWLAKADLCEPAIEDGKPTAAALKVGRS